MSFCIVSANVRELSALPALTEQTRGTLVICGHHQVAIARRRAVGALPLSQRDSHPRWSAELSRLRCRIDTVFGQLVDRCDVKRVWAGDLWHLRSRLLRKVLMPADACVAVLLNVERGNPSLHLAQVVA